MLPTSIILGRGKRGKPSRWDMLLAEAEKTLEMERCPQCGNPRWVCFAGETEVITRDGTKPIRDLVGRQTLLSRAPGGNGPAKWVDAEIKSFGVQCLMRVDLSRGQEKKTVFATPEHRWFIKKPVKMVNGTRDWKQNVEVRTHSLNPGDKLLESFTQKRHSATPSPIGIVAGFTFGDGHKTYNQARLELFGEKDRALLPYLSPLQEVAVKNLGDGYADDEALMVFGLPRSWKEFPSLDEGAVYLRSWLSGYFAADGTVSKSGSVTLACSSPEILERVRDVATICGIGTFGVRTYARKGIGGKVSDISYVSFVKEHLTPDFFIIAEHRRRFESNPGTRRSPTTWTVTSVSLTDRVEEVFCAVVPETGAFVLKDNILTGNCQSDDSDIDFRVYDETCNAMRKKQQQEEKNSKKKGDRSGIIVGVEAYTHSDTPLVEFREPFYLDKERSRAESEKGRVIRPREHPPGWTPESDES